MALRSLSSVPSVPSLSPMSPMPTMSTMSSRPSLSTKHNRGIHEPLPRAEREGLRLDVCVRVRLLRLLSVRGGRGAGASSGRAAAGTLPVPAGGGEGRVCGDGRRVERHG
jgi:hypothetical protein